MKTIFISECRITLLNMTINRDKWSSPIAVISSFSPRKNCSQITITLMLCVSTAQRTQRRHVQTDASFTATGREKNSSACARVYIQVLHLRLLELHNMPLVIPAFVSYARWCVMIGSRQKSRAPCG